MSEANPAETPYRFVTSDDCSHCADMKRDFPEFRKVAPEVKLDEKKCEVLPGIGETCYTGADLLIQGKINYTPACTVTYSEGKVRACKPEEEDMVLKGIMPDPTQFNPKPRKQREFKFADPRDVKL